jgi:hypothetical protein
VPVKIVVLGALFPLPAHSRHSSVTCCIPAVVCSRRHSLLHGTSHLSSWKYRHTRFPAIESRSAAAGSKSFTSRSSASARPSCLFSRECSYRLSHADESRCAGTASRSSTTGSSASARSSRPSCHDASDGQPQWIPTAHVCSNAWVRPASCIDHIQRPIEEATARNTSLWTMSTTEAEM